MIRGKKEVWLAKGVYRLYKDGEVVYIGASTTSCIGRIVQHENEAKKDFDSFSISPMPDKTERQIFSIEKRAIKKNRPKYNVVHNKGKERDWKTAEEIEAQELRNKAHKLGNYLPVDMPDGFKESIYEHLKSFKWARFKAEYMSHKPRCFKCNKRKGVVLVHLNANAIFNETRQNVKPICGKCPKKNNISLEELASSLI